MSGTNDVISFEIITGNSGRLILNDTLSGQCDLSHLPKLFELIKIVNFSRITFTRGEPFNKINISPRKNLYEFLSTTLKYGPNICIVCEPEKHAPKTTQPNISPPIPFEQKELWNKLDLRVDSLHDVPVRIRNGLYNNNCVYFGDAVKLSINEFNHLPNIGKKSVVDFQDLLAKHGLHFGMDVQGWTPPDQRNPPEATPE